MAKKFFLTTPIYYVNDKPHIGHAYTMVAADSIARFYRATVGKKNVTFLTGTDEHGAKVAESALKAGKEPKKFADENSKEFIRAWKALGVEYDQFIRTTDPKHKKFVQDVLRKIYDNGFIYKGTYKGKYCIGCERFVPENEIANNRCPLHPNRDLVDQEEENYFFRLSKFKDKIGALIRTGVFEILPEERKNEILGKLGKGLNDISISRAGVSWGVPLPWDTTHTVYVWVDALLNYVSAPVIAKKNIWPAQLHLVGKDILWFHTVIWPALLLAAEMELPKRVFAHGFFTIEGQKMSKSLGNVIAPADLVLVFGVDGARYILLTGVPFGHDGDISKARFAEVYNADLANGIGNLASRIAKLAERLPENPVPKKMKFHWYADLVSAFSRVRPDLALGVVTKKVHEMDKAFNDARPWEKNDKALEKVLKPLIISLREIAFNLAPFLPNTAAVIEKQFAASRIKKGEPLFLRKS